MSWLNLNQSLSSLKGQITNFASEVLLETSAEESSNVAESSQSLVKELEAKCHNQELEIAALKKQNDDLLASLRSEKLAKQNGAREDESNWYWDPPSLTAKPTDETLENEYKVQIRTLQNELTSLKENTFDQDKDEELKRLKEENLNLTTNLEDLDTQHQLAMERLLLLKKELQKNFEVLKQEHEELKSANDDYAVEIKSLLQKLSERDKEIDSLKHFQSEHETLQHKYQNLEKVHGMLKESTEKFQEENQDLHEEVFKLQERITNVEHDLEIATKHSSKTDLVPREKYEELIKELNDMNDRRNTNHDHLTNIDDNAKSLIESLRREINELKHQLSQKGISNLDLEHKIIKSEKVMQLYNKYVNFELPIDYVGEIPAPGDDIIMYKLESVFKTVHSFKKDIDSLEHQLSEKNLNLNHLQTQIDDLTTENDFLSTDLQHYERELGEMKKNNDFLISEIAMLKNTSKLEPIIETHEDNLAKLETELEDCNKINKSFESEIKRIEEELAEVKTEKVVLQESLHDLKSKYTTILNELEIFKTQTKEVEELESANSTELAKQLELKISELDDLKRRLQASNAKNEQLSIDIHIVENDKVLLTKEIDDLKNALKDKCDKYEAFEALKISFEKKIEELEDKLNIVTKHKNEAEEHKLSLEQKLLSIEKENLNSDGKTFTINKNIQSEGPQSEVQNASLLKQIEELKLDITDLKNKQDQLLLENSELKNMNVALNSNSSVIQKALDDFKSKNAEQELLEKEISKLKDLNTNLNERKIQLESELSNTDTKIVHLEEEFEKLISDLNDKDSLIDNLNGTINNNSAVINTLKQKVSELENSVVNKTNENDKLILSVDDLKQKLHATGDNVNQSYDELNKLHKEKEDVSKQILALSDELSSKNEQISNFTVMIEELRNTCSEHVRSIDDREKNIQELNQKVADLLDKLNVIENSTLQNEDYHKIVQEKEIIVKECSDIKSTVIAKDNELLNLKSELEKVEKTCLEYQKMIENATAEKAELINLVNMKHNESLQYHNEIQRLNHVILEQSNEFKRVVEENEKVLSTKNENCSNCERLKITLKEKDEIIINLTHNNTEVERLKAELMNASETTKSLTEKCANLDKSLAVQLDTVKKLTAENMELSDKEQNASKELERLRHHLMESEENHTQELMITEQKLTECQTRLHQVEERAKQTSTVYTSNSIRANQEVETLRNQIKLLEKQREEVQARLSDAEDARSRSEAAVTNLQVVLEQFQLDKERDIHTATEKIRNKMDELKQENSKLLDEIAKLNRKLEESLAGLQAASRLGDQVETKAAQINDLKEQVRTLQTSVSAAEERYYNAISNQQDKVDKNLVKNLVINYVITSTNNNHNKTQVLRILSTVLDFNQQECEKLGLARSSAASDSLAAEFVKFLQDESRPRAPLPNIMGLTQNSSRSTTPNSRKSSTIGPNPYEISHKRNPSTGSNNLLFQNLDSVETSSQISVESSDHSKTATIMDTGVNQTRNTESAILKHVLKDM